MEKRIYVDHAATTAVHPKVLEAMLPYFSAIAGNPSSVYAEGREARKAVEEAREKVAEIFYAGGSGLCGFYPRQHGGIRGNNRRDDRENFG